MSVEAPGFQTIVRDNLQLNVSQVLAVNLDLNPGNVQDTVTVSTAPVLQTKEVSTGQVAATTSSSRN